MDILNPFNSYAFIEGSGNDLLDQENTEFFTSNGKTYAYFLRVLSATSQFICEKPSIKSELELVTPTSEPVIESQPKFKQSDFSLNCGNDNFGYAFAEQTGQCYKFHSQAVQTWDDAKKACESEGAHLAIVNSDKEADTLAELFANYPPNRISGAYYFDTAAIGYFYNEYSDEWQTLDGETLEQAGYNSWRPDAPFVLARYGFICRDGLLYGYVPAVRDVPFICEKKPSEVYLDPEVITSPFRLEITETTIASEDNELQPELEAALSPTLSCGENSFGYQLFNKKKICIKTHVLAEDSKKNAKIVCESEGAQLAETRNNKDLLLYAKLFVRDSTMLDRSGTTDFKDVDVENYDFYEDETQTMEATVATMEEIQQLKKTERTVYIKRSDGTAWFACEKNPVKEFQSSTANSKFEIENETSTETSTEAVIQTREEIAYKTTVATITDFELENSAENFAEAVTETTVEASTENVAESATGTEPDILVDYNIGHATDLSITPSCGNKDLGFKYSETREKCYKFFTQTLNTLFEMNSRCEDEGANLAFVYSGEIEFINEIFNKVPTEILDEYNILDVMNFIGSYKRYDIGSVSVQGQTQQQAFFTLLGPDSSKPKIKKLPLAFSHRDKPYKSEKLFICEKPSQYNL